REPIDVLAPTALPFALEVLGVLLGPWRHAKNDLALANPAVVAARSLFGNPGADQRADDTAAHRACRAAGQRCRDGAHRQQPDPRQRDDARRGEAGENGAERATDGGSDSRALGHLAAELRPLTHPVVLGV